MIRNSMTPEKLRLLQNLEHDIYAEIGPSEVQGMGVIAIRDIPEGTDPFPLPYRPGFPERIVELTEEEISFLPKYAQSKIRSFYIKTNGTYPVNWDGLNGCDVRSYLNHSEEPNLALDNDFGVVGAARIRIGTIYCPFKSIRDIKEGEELTWNYRSCEEADDLHKQFPFIKRDGNILSRAWDKLKK